MYKIYTTDESGLLYEVNEISYGCWVNMISPNDQEINHVVSTLGIPLDFIKDPLDEEERSRIEKEDNHILIIVDMPVLTKNEKNQTIYETVPLGMIITGDCFVTVCSKEHPIIYQFIHNKVKQFNTNKKTRFSLQVLYIISTYYLRYLKQISKITDQIEKELHQSMKNKELYQLLNLEKSLVYFTTSLKSNNIVLQKMLKSQFLKKYEEDQDLLEDVIIENQQAIEMAEIHSSILSGMVDAFASVISNNLNIVMKFLTSITIIISLPTMVASFYGMNVHIPFQTYPHAFLMPIIISIILSCITAFIFWKKRFF